jgi:hypothetical protein
MPADAVPNPIAQSDALHFDYLEIDPPAFVFSNLN